MAQTKIWTGDPVWIADVLRAEGVKLVEFPGWQNRGHGDFKDIRGVMVHHTGSDNASAASIANGRPDLPGPLSQLHIARDGTVTVVAVGVAWHARRRAVPLAADEHGQLAHDRHRVRQQRYQSDGPAPQELARRAVLGDGELLRGDQPQAVADVGPHHRTQGVCRSGTRQVGSRRDRHGHPARRHPGPHRSSDHVRRRLRGRRCRSGCTPTCCCSADRRVRRSPSFNVSSASRSTATSARRPKPRSGRFSAAHRA